MILALDTFGGNAVQLQILLACAERPSSARDVAGVGQHVAKTAYHFRQMHARGYLSPAGETVRRGALVKFYDATPKGKELLGTLGLDHASA